MSTLVIAEFITFAKNRKKQRRKHLSTLCEPRIPHFEEWNIQINLGGYNNGKT